jgi:hypothetical protein
MLLIGAFSAPFCFEFLELELLAGLLFAIPKGIRLLNENEFFELEFFELKAPVAAFTAAFTAPTIGLVACAGGLAFISKVLFQN